MKRVRTVTDGETEIGCALTVGVRYRLTVNLPPDDTCFAFEDSLGGSQHDVFALLGIAARL